MSQDNLSHCPRCGAVPRDGKTCKDKYGEILALEFEDPAVFGAVHHITVLCHNLQHSDYFSEESLAWMRSTLRSVIVDGMTPDEVLKLARNGVAEGRKVRRRTPVESPTPSVKWSMTVMDVRMDSAETYIADIRAWAESILKDLDVK